MKNKKTQRQIRHQRVKSHLKKTYPRLVVFRSNKHIYAQIIDDNASKTIAATSDTKIEKKSNLQKAKETGLDIAKIGVNKYVKNVVFDRAGYKYHGRVKALADGAREGGLTF